MGNKENMGQNKGSNGAKAKGSTRRIVIESPNDDKGLAVIKKSNSKKLVKPGPRQLARITRRKSTSKPPVVPKIITAEVINSKPKSTKIDADSKKTNVNKKSTKREAKSQDDMKIPRIRRIHFKIQYVILTVIVLLLAVFFGRIAIWEKHYLADKTGSERDKPTSSTGESFVYEGGEDIDETEPTETQIFEYKVAADKPRYLTIRSLGIYNSCITEIGLKPGGELDVPTNIYFTGWYVKSALPGTNGVSVMDAHGGDLGNGIFKNLPKIQNGAEIVVEMGDGRKFTYVVADTAWRKIGDEANAYMETAFSSPKNGVPSLTLITCTGEWSQVQHTYNQRFFVRALLKSAS